MTTQVTDGAASEPGDIRLKVHGSAPLGAGFTFFRKHPDLIGSLPTSRTDLKTGTKARLWNEGWPHGEGVTFLLWLLTRAVFTVIKLI